MKKQFNKRSLPQDTEKQSEYILTSIVCVHGTAHRPVTVYDLIISSRSVFFSPSVAEEQLLVKGFVLGRSQDWIWEPLGLDEVTTLLLWILNHLVRKNCPAVMSL